jgi:hypothetical protein
MAKQRLGDTKLQRCRLVGGKPYVVAFVRGGWPHYTAECWYTEHDADWVNYKRGEVSPCIRAGKFVNPASSQARLLNALGLTEIEAPSHAEEDEAWRAFEQALKQSTANGEICECTKCSEENPGVRVGDGRIGGARTHDCSATY